MNRSLFEKSVYSAILTALSLGLCSIASQQAVAAEPGIAAAVGDNLAGSYHGEHGIQVVLERQSDGSYLGLMGFECLQDVYRFQVRPLGDDTLSGCVITEISYPTRRIYPLEPYRIQLRRQGSGLTIAYQFPGMDRPAVGSLRSGVPAIPNNLDRRLIGVWEFAPMGSAHFGKDITRPGGTTGFISETREIFVLGQSGQFAVYRLSQHNFAGGKVSADSTNLQLIGGGTWTASNGTLTLVGSTGRIPIRYQIVGGRPIFTLPDANGTRLDGVPGSLPRKLVGGS